MKRITAIACASALLTLISGTALHGQVSFPGPELLGRPTDRSVTVNVVAAVAINAYFEYGVESGVYPYQTGIVTAAANVPLVAVIDDLASDTRYFYRMQYRPAGSTTWIARDEHSFHTQRAAGGTFAFTVTSDSHINILFGNTSLYQQTLNNVDADRPDFHLDLGDTFAMDNVTTVAQARNAYLSQRPFMGLFSHSAPIFLALGNHEQEEGWHRDDTGNLATSKPILGANARKRYFLNPVPDAFYSGNTDVWPALTGDGLPGDYYAWRWGDALFVVIDPYWYTTTKPFLGNIGGGESSDPGSGDRWDWTLGLAQYQWLKQTLETSDASLKFIFAHHGTGGTDDYIRSGANGAPFTEWGGHNEDGTTWAFDERRAGWHAPVHQLLADTHVTAFFHGHDHEFAYEERDGVVYQLVPMAADPTYGFGFQGYSESDPHTIRVLPNSGHLRVTVSASTATVDYVRAFLPGEGNNAEVAYSYTMTGWTGGTPTVASIQASPEGGSGPVSVSWNGIASPSAWDWMALYAPGTPDTAYLGWIYTSCSNTPGSGAASGSCSFEVPSTVPPGTYEMRLFANGEKFLLATSVPFTLTMTTGPALSISPTTMARAGTVTATWSGIDAPTPTDWMAIYAVGTDDEAFIDWIYTSCSKTTGAGTASGACAFVVPWHVAPGMYEMRLFANGQYARIATSNALAVTLAGEPTVSADPVASRGNPVTTSWSGIATPTPNDWLGIYVPGTADEAYLDWIYVSCTTTAGEPAASGTCPFVVPWWVASGPYEIRLFSNGGSGVYRWLATSPPLVVGSGLESIVSARSDP